MRKNIPYRDQLIELSKLYKIQEIKSYINSKKKLTTSQIELILLKNKVRLPEHSYSKKKVAEIKFKEQVLTNVLVTCCLIIFLISLVSVRPYIKSVTNEIKFTYIAKEYKSNKKLFSEKDFKGEKLKNKNESQDDKISLDTKITLNLFENLKYDLNNIRLGESVKPVYLSKLPPDLKNISSTSKRKDTFIKIILPLIIDENNKILENRAKLFKILGKPSNSMGEKRWLKRRFEDYQIKNEDVSELKLRMDVIPVSIAIAQAAKESGWGTSRFALKGNAMFGQWTYGKGGIKPKDSKGKDHKILAFPMLRSSIIAYQRNLNTHKAYGEFRENRGKLRQDSKKISGTDLVIYLENYAATGKEYVKILKSIISQNKLTDFDNATLMNTNKDSSLIL
tara:strand:+ start:2002 stop:3180 length:1179 start_codon:yes stop_codon:yes gene_type:complete